MLEDTLSLSRAGRLVRSFSLGDTPLEVGSDPTCDLTVHHTDVPPRALLVCPSGGTVYVYDLLSEPSLKRRKVMRLAVPFEIGGGFSVLREKGPPRRPESLGTERLREGQPAVLELCLVSPGGAGARAFPIRDRPLSIGSAPDNAIALSDRAVSRYHCRIEPGPRGCFVRDLGSTNGTWLNGLRVQRQQLRPGAALRMGRTHLRVADRGVSARGPGLVASSASMLSLMSEVDRWAGLSWPVLIRGETGVGKELFARALHERGPRSSGPFVPLNGGGLPRALIESELFGHERGAFTGAAQSHRGAFEQAHGGTLFLDEVAELPLDLQTRLLRVLETWRVRRVGAECVRRVDVRLVCATHADLRAEVQRGRFRADLFYRIHRLLIEVPPLRARPDDVAPLAKHFLSLMREEVGLRELDPEAIERLRRHHWPGNVRELRNVLELAAVDTHGARIGARSVDRAIGRTGEAAVAGPSRDVLQEALAQYRGNLSATARALGIPRSTLRDRLKGDTATKP